MKRFSDKVSIVTGAASGIGRASARLFAQEGAKVAVFDVDLVRGEETVDMIRRDGGSGEGIFLLTDVTKRDNARSSVGKVIERYGRVDILHNNAGGWKREHHDTVVDDSEEDWDRIIDLNLKSVFLMSREVIPSMVKNGGGCIVNTTSINAFMTREEAAAYSAAKAGVSELTKAMALDYAKYNIRVNGIAPGEVLTPQSLSSIRTLPDPEGVIEKMKGRIPLGRLAQPDDVAKTAMWLVSEEAAYVTGEIVVVDGGLTAGHYRYM